MRRSCSRWRSACPSTTICLSFSTNRPAVRGWECRGKKSFNFAKCGPLVGYRPLFIFSIRFLGKEGDNYSEPKYVFSRKISNLKFCTKNNSLFRKGNSGMVTPNRPNSGNSDYANSPNEVTIVSILIIDTIFRTAKSSGPSRNFPPWNLSISLRKTSLDPRFLRMKIPYLNVAFAKITMSFVFSIIPFYQ